MKNQTQKRKDTARQAATKVLNLNRELVIENLAFAIGGTPFGEFLQE
jgi:hypothetical protein